MIGQALAAILNVFRYHKLKVILTVVSAAVFVVLLFPYDDLAEVVSTMVAERTNNQVFLQFDRLGIQVIPYPALAVENVVVESSFLPPLQAASLSLTPSISGFLSFRPGFKAGIRRVWNGDIHIELKGGKKTEQGASTQNLHLDIEKIDLAKINEAIDLPLKLQGALSSDAQVNLDPTFASQPEGEISLQIKELRFPSGTIPTQMGPVSLPGLSWSNIQLRGRLTAGRLIIESAELGAPSDLFNGTVKGEMEVRFEPRGAGQVGLNWGAYQLQLDLNVNSKLERELGPFLLLIGSFKSPTTTGVKYKFKMAGQRFGQTPSISPAN